MIDAHLHIKKDVACPVQVLLDDMNANGIEKSVVILNNYEEEQAFQRDIDGYINSQERLALALALNPQDKRTLEYAKEFYREFPIYHIGKVHPRYMKVTEEDFPEIERLVRWLDMKVLIIDCLVYGHEYRYNVGVQLGIYLAERCETLKIVLAHSGSTRLLETLMMTRWLNNIYYDTAFICPFYLDTSVERDMMFLLQRTDQRVMYGTDYPYFNMAQVQSEFRKLMNCANLTQKKIDNICHKNAERIYAL